MWMRRTRSGARSRLWPFAAPQYTVALEELVVFNLLFGLVPLFGFAFLFGNLGHEAVTALRDPSDEVHRLRSPTSPQPGIAHISGRLQAEQGDGICFVVHEYDHGKGGWRVRTRHLVGRHPTVVLDDGQQVEVGFASLAFSPALLRKVDDEARWRSILELGSGGRVREHCARSGERVFIEGCLVEGAEGRRRVEGCDGAAVLTTGDGSAQPRIDERAAWFAGRFAMLGIPALMLLTYLWSVVRARPLATALLRWSDYRATPMPKRLLAALAAAPVLLVAALYALAWVDVDWFGIDRYGYAWTAVTLCAAAGLALFVDRRRRALAAACQPIERAPTTALRDARGDLVELDVRVADDAPTSPGPLTGRPRAHHGIRVTRIYKTSTNHESEEVVDRCEPARVPVVDASGDGWLDMTHAEVDLRAMRRVVRESRSFRREYAAALEGATRGTGTKAFVIEERYLEPGERLFVLGAVQRLEPAVHEGGYRAASIAPVVGGSPRAKLIVHAGTERSLLRSIGVERRYLGVLLGMVASVGIAVLAAAGYFISR
jgi:hypothetical protein